MTLTDAWQNYHERIQAIGTLAELRAASGQDDLEELFFQLVG